MNQHCIMGRIGKVHDLKTFSDGGAILSFSVATDRRVKRDDKWESETDWHNVRVRGNRASALQKHLVKGMFVGVMGTSRTRKYTDRDNSDRTITELHAYDVTIAWPPKGSQQHAPAEDAPPNDAFARGDDAFARDDDDLPF